MQVACGVILLLVLVDANGSSLPTCKGYDAVQADTDVAGKLLSAKSGSASDCCSLCDAAVACEGWSWFNSTCYLKAELTGTYVNKGRVAGVRSSPVDCTGFGEQQSDKDLVGALLKKIFAPTSAHCCTACTHDNNCEGFTFFQQICYLKGNVTGTFSSKGRVARRRSSSLTERATEPSCGGYDSLQNDTDLAGTMLATKPGEISDCCSLCDTMRNCSGWSWFNNVCYLKGFLTGTYAQKGRVTGVKSTTPGNCPGFEEEQKDMDLAGTLLQKMWAPDNPSTCCEECTHNEQCEGFAYFQHYCYLKGNVTGTYHNPGRITQCNFAAEDRCHPFDPVILV
eukprot:gnl/MRDRNA2_/MRDRNA2_118074_c0_seq1.p1 gnl/MRDRNA2_/MRDRNA2_118074_c0~~gnl/MRDRNA2_/MRDRNA2_118074_c0_seq1.p1  ORF type:complete len:338 (+),score=48.34 gnl/MRDRNA2_/MRDRNA2_118074_c0_seq1:77-1090(+)